MRAHRKRPEQELHLAVAKFLRVALRPPVFWTSIDHGSGKLAKASAGLAKARGVKAGLMDVWVFAPQTIWSVSAHCGNGSVVLGIELKAGNGKLSDAQEVTHADMMVAGVRCRVARSLEQVQDILRANGIPLHARVSA